jgi:hypothetical protein
LPDCIPFPDPSLEPDAFIRLLDAGILPHKGFLTPDTEPSLCSEGRLPIPLHLGPLALRTLFFSSN